MPDKLTAIKIKQENGTYGPQIPVGAKAENVQYKNTEYSIEEVIGDININKGPLQEQIDNIDTSAIGPAVEDWMDAHASASTQTVIDNTLSLEGAAADAKQAGKVVTVNNQANGNATKLHFNTTNDVVNILTDEDIDPNDIDILKNVVNNYIIKDTLSFDFVDNTSITPDSDVSGLINREGTIVANASYKIATFNAIENNIYKISHQTGSSFGNIRAIEIIKDNNVIDYIAPTSNTIEVHYITNFTGLVRICYRAQNTNSLNITVQKAELELKYNTFKNGFIDPDDYSGTDSEKIQAAMSAIGDLNHGIILIKRAYTLTSSINISHDVNTNNRIVFLGVGNDSGFIMGPYRFKSLTQTKSYGMISFENLYFTGTGVLFAAEYLLRVTFFNCTFYGGTNAVRNSHYMQSWTFNLCTFRDFSAYVIYSALPTVEGETISIYDVTFNQCLIERCKGFMYTNKLIGVSIMQCCIEGLTGPVCTVVTQARSLSVIGNYFEYNNCRIPNPDYETDPTQPQYIGSGGAGVHFDFTRLVGNLSTITIANNNFVTSVYPPDTVNTIILLPPNKPKIGYIIIQDNDLSYGSDRYLVKAHDNATDIYTNVLLSGNTNDAYDGGPNNLLINLNKNNISNINYIQDNSQLSDLIQSGFYYASENANITDRPAEGELFLINLRCNDGKAQLAITNEGIKTRINDGSWV